MASSAVAEWWSHLFGKLAVPLPPVKSGVLVRAVDPNPSNDAAILAGESAHCGGCISHPSRIGKYASPYNPERTKYQGPCMGHLLASGGTVNTLSLHAQYYPNAIS